VQTRTDKWAVIARKTKINRAKEWAKEKNDGNKMGIQTLKPIKTSV